MSDRKMGAATRLAKLDAPEPAYLVENAPKAHLFEKLGELYCKREVLEALIIMLERYRECGCRRHPGRAK